MIGPFKVPAKLSLSSKCWGFCGLEKDDEAPCGPQAWSLPCILSNLPQEWKTRAQLSVKDIYVSYPRNTK